MAPRPETLAAFGFKAFRVIVACGPSLNLGMSVAWKCSMLAEQKARSTRMIGRKILPKLLFVFWVLSTVLVTTAWWAGLAWAAVRLVEIVS